MITVRIAHAEYRPGMERVGTFRADRVLVVLADDAGGRALPIWLPSMDGYSIAVSGPVTRFRHWSPRAPSSSSSALPSTAAAGSGCATRASVAGTETPAVPGSRHYS
jgi:hypothetical protein